MKRFTSAQKFTASLLAAVFMIAACGDKIQTAKTTISFIALAVVTAQSAFDEAEKIQKAECLKKGQEGSAEYIKCFAPMQKALEVWAATKPQLENTLELSAAAIKAAEQKQAGQSVDYVTPIKKGVCLLTSVVQVIPGEKWKKKIQAFLALASAYACDTPSVTVQASPEHQLYVLKQMHKLLSELLSA